MGDPQVNERIRIRRLPWVCETTGQSRASIYRRLKTEGDDFPKPRRLGPNSIGWLESEIRAWLDSRPKVELPIDRFLESEERR